MQGVCWSHSEKQWARKNSSWIWGDRKDDFLTFQIFSDDLMNTYVMPGTVSVCICVSLSLYLHLYWYIHLYLHLHGSVYLILTMTLGDNISILPRENGGSPKFSELLKINPRISDTKAFVPNCYTGLPKSSVSTLYIFDTYPVNLIVVGQLL